jgi:hypothetical protein
VHQTDRFRALYEEVTHDLEKYIKDELTGIEATWFRDDLIRGFDAEFLNWEKAKGATADYLYRLDESSVHDDVRLAGHVFLHIAYDLPRVLADTFLARKGIQSTGRTAFIRPNPRFLKVFLAHLKSGRLGVLGWFVGHVDAMRVLGFWVIALRMTAWIHAEALAEAHDPQNPTNRDKRNDLEARMADGLHRAADRALSQRWIVGVPDLDSSVMVAGVPAFLEELTTTQAVGLTAILAILGGTIAATSSAVRRRRVLATIEVFGALVHRNMTRALNRELSLSDERRRETDQRSRG